MRYFLILLTFISNTILSQDLILFRTIQWQENKNLNDYIFNPEDYVEKNEYFYFKDAVFENSETHLPYYNELIKADNYYANIEITVENPVFITVPPTEYNKVSNIDLLSTDLVLNNKIVYKQKNPYILFSVLPLRRNEVSDSIEKLISFSIRIMPKSSALTKSTQSVNASSAFKESSVLNSGEWFKVKISTSGIYKLTYSDLLNVGISNPADVRIYGNGGKTLPLMNYQPYIDDLEENAIYMEKGTDGVFNSGDYILFYAQGMVNWKYDTSRAMFIHSIHDYSSYTCYYLTSSLGPGKKIQAAENIELPSNYTVTEFDACYYHERNLINVIESGRQWFGESLDYSSFDTTFNFTNLIKTSPVKLLVNVLGRSSDYRTFTIKANNITVSNISTNPVDLNSISSQYGHQVSEKSVFNVTDELISVSVEFNRISDSDKGWLDYIIMNGRRQLIYSEKPFYFRDIESVGPEMISEFKVQGSDNQTIIWDLTDIYNIKQMNIYANGQGMAFKAETDTLHEFIAFDKTINFLTPLIDNQNKRVENQNLHGIQPHKMIIITAPLFINQAERLANYHREKDNFSIYVTTTDKIYNEFSSGTRDVSALRNFIRLVYEKSDSDNNALKYLLLFGDGSFNNISDHPDNPNFIPTYQSENSLLPTYSYVCDDYFGFLDVNEGGTDAMKDFLLDIGVGRLPVKDTTEASDVVRKIMSYNNSLSMQDWRNNILFIGDDEEGNIHMSQSNSLGDSIMKNHPEYAVRKIMLDAYKQTSSSGGNRYPDVNRAIADNFNRGILIFNYTGHGGEVGIAAEQILMSQDIQKLKNSKYPLFITATCEFSRFDYLARNEDGQYKEQTTAGELALLNPKGGAIALLTTTRVVSGPDNNYLNQKFYKVMFDRDEYGNRYRLGDIIKEAKIATGSQRNKLNFVLLGDPALELAYPEYKIITDSVNGVSINEPLDTLKAFTKIKVSGHVVDYDSVIMSDFNGIVFPSVFDKKQLVTTLANDGGNTMNFFIQENLLYRGKATVENGFFDFEFIVPKDISYNIDNGKITYYAENEISDANGYFAGFQIGGTSDNILYDNAGPIIELFINDENFRSGGITDKNPIIFARVWDENGINTIGNGIGHDIVGILNGQTSNPLILNDYYQSQQDDYRSGEVIYQLNDIEPGLHNLSVKIWDIFNNSSEETLEFYVIESEKFVLEKVYNFPNPVTDYTLFQFEHNMPGYEFNVSIDIFDLSGRVIRTLSLQSYASGYRSEAIEWDARDLYGNKVPRGIYPYRLKVETNDGQYAEQFAKLIILN